MIKIGSIRLFSSFSLMLLLAAVLTASAVLPATGTSAGPAADNALAFAVSGDDIICVEVVHTNKASAAASKPGGYVLTGYKWPSTPVTYAINHGSIPAGLIKTAVSDAIKTSAETWDAATGAELFKDAVSDTTAAYGVYDQTNAVTFAPIASSGTIAVTMYWFNRKTKALLEFDMCFNTNYPWGISGSTSGTFMDIRNIATHEFGHSVGLGDLYKTTTADLTMYGYANYNEINKTSLEAGDIAGIQFLYGQ